MAEEVLINFVGDTSRLVPVENALDTIIEKDAEAGAAWKKTSEQMANSSKVSIDTTNKLAKSIENIATATKTMDKAIIGGAYKGYLKEIQTQLGYTNKEIISYIQNAKKAAQEKIITDATDQEVKELTISIEVMNEQLQQMGVFQDETGTKTQSLKSRIREAKDELVAMAEAGLQGTPAFAALQDKAGKLDDQMRDLNATVKGLGSDTKHIDGLISLASGVAGGFALAQGAAALFGNENEEVQKALLKVNAAMSILQGLQAIQNVLQKESAAMLLLSEGKTKALALAQQFLTATELETAAASNVLRVALIATGIGAFVVLIGTVINAMSLFGDETDDTTSSLEQFNLVLDRTQGYLADEVDAIKLNNKRLLEYAKQRGAKEDELNKIKAQGDKYVTEAYVKYANIQSQKAIELAKQFGITIHGTVENAQEAKRVIEELENVKVSPAFAKADDKQKKGLDETLAAFKKVYSNLNEIKKVSDEREIESEETKTKHIEDLRQKGIENAKKAAQEAKEERKRELDDALAASERKLLAVKKGTQAEVDIQKEIIRKKADIDLNGEKLKANQIALIKEKALNDQLALQKEFNKKFAEADYQDQINDNNAQLALLNITNEEKLRLTIENIQAQSALEIIAAEGNAHKIIEINAKTDKQIRDAKITSIEDVKTKELAAYTANSHDIIKLNEKIAASDKSSPKQKIDAINNLKSIKDEEIDIEFAALEKKKGLIDDYDVKYKELLNKRKDLEASTEEQITDVQKKEIDKRVAQLNAVIGLAKGLFQEGLYVTLDTSAAKTALNELVNLTDTIFQIINDKNLSQEEKTAAIIAASISAGQQIINQIFSDGAARRQQDLQFALEALDEQKNKELDNKNLTEQQKADIDKKYKDKERVIKLHAWEADKEAKKQQAIINGALAVTAALPNYLLAALVAATTIAEVAIINKTKPPKFFRGKEKGTYQGWGIVDDGGKREPIYRADGRIEVSTGPVKDRTTWLGKDDIVFPSMDHMYKHFSFPQIPEFLQPAAKNGHDIDYEKLSDLIATKMKGVIPGAVKFESINDENGQRRFIVTSTTRTESKNKRYSMS